MISTESLSKKYGDKFVLREVSASLPENKITAFIGCNGAGKSTMLNIISRLIPASEGCAFVDGKKVSEWDSRKLAQNLAILGQNSHRSARISVEELVAFGRFPHSGGRLGDRDFKMVEHALKITGIEELRDRFMDELSGGQRQMAHIAMSIAQDTKYILLDEPLNNLDMSRSVKIMKLLRKLAREESKTIIIVIHDINFVSFYADHIVALKDGKIRYEGAVEAVMKPEILSDIYGMRIEIEEYKGKKICVYYQ